VHVISVISPSYYNEVNFHGFMKLFNFHGMWKCTLHLALDGAFHGATKPVQKCKNIIDFINDNLGVVK